MPSLPAFLQNIKVLGPNQVCDDLLLLVFSNNDTLINNNIKVSNIYNTPQQDLTKG